MRPARSARSPRRSTCHLGRRSRGRPGTRGDDRSRRWRAVGCPGRTGGPRSSRGRRVHDGPGLGRSARAHATACAAMVALRRRSDGDHAPVHFPRATSSCLRTVGLFVMIPSTPRSSSMAISAGSSMVQAWTCMPSP